MLISTPLVNVRNHVIYLYNEKAYDTGEDKMVHADKKAIKEEMTKKIN
jgi:hypothetical protein